MLLLALVAALSINLSVFFPNEHAATAEIAVLLAAVTGFSGDAHWLGPLVVALLMGPLDASHGAGRSRADGVIRRLRAGEAARARTLFARRAARANDVGLLSEEVDSAT